MPVTLVTHSGRFHADEIFAIAMIQMIKSVEIIRSRDPEIIDQADIVLDVGADYNPDTLRFDHHQNSFTKTRADGTPFATAGLVWEHFGTEILTQKGLKGNDEIQFAQQWVDQKIIHDIDAVDNGLFTEDPRPSVSMIIGMMNASSTEDDDAQKKAFDQAIEFTSTILNNFIKAAIKEAENIVELEACAKTVQDGLLILDKPLPFKDFLTRKPHIKRVVYPRNDEQFGVYCNGKENHLPERFRGLRSDELNAITGLDDTVFCHKTGFMCVTKSQNSALIIAKSH